MNEIVVSSWEQFNQTVFEHCWDEKLKRYRSNYIFRGLSKKTYSLMPSLNRVCESSLYLEKSLLRNFKKYASLQLSNSENIWDILSMAQHHGLPTRLLDWTFSPFVAAHFATEDFDRYLDDGAIWCLDFVKCHSHLPEKLSSILSKEDAYGFSTEMLEGTSLNDLALLEKTNGPFPVFFEPPAIDDRIINQYALFSVMSDPAVLLSDWLEGRDYCYKIIIPAKSKLEIRDKLDQINVTERIIYPGLDGLCKWLARHYRLTDSIYPDGKDEIT